MSFYFVESYCGSVLGDWPYFNTAYLEFYVYTCFGKNAGLPCIFRIRLSGVRNRVILSTRKVRAYKGGLPSFIGGANPPDERKEGDANVRYIFGFDPDRYLIGCPCKSSL